MKCIHRTAILSVYAEREPATHALVKEPSLAFPTEYISQESEAQTARDASFPAVVRILPNYGVTYAGSKIWYLSVFNTHTSALCSIAKGAVTEVCYRQGGKLCTYYSSQPTTHQRCRQKFDTRYTMHLNAATPARAYSLGFPGNRRLDKGPICAKMRHSNPFLSHSRNQKQVTSSAMIRPRWPLARPVAECLFQSGEQQGATGISANVVARRQRRYFQGI